MRTVIMIFDGVVYNNTVAREARNSSGQDLNTVSVTAADKAAAKLRTRCSGIETQAPLLLHRRWQSGQQYSCACTGRRGALIERSIGRIAPAT